ncbi:uncharacterized protein LOC144352616 [Saccoglossus kowalevskii]
MPADRKEKQKRCCGCCSVYCGSIASGFYFIMLSLINIIVGMLIRPADDARSTAIKHLTYSSSVFNGVILLLSAAMIMATMLRIGWTLLLWIVGVCFCLIFVWTFHVYFAVIMISSSGQIINDLYGLPVLDLVPTMSIYCVVFVLEIIVDVYCIYTVIVTYKQMKILEMKNRLRHRIYMASIVVTIPYYDNRSLTEYFLKIHLGRQNPTSSEKEKKTCKYWPCYRGDMRQHKLFFV